MYVARPATSYRVLGMGEGADVVGIVAASFALVPLFVAIPLGRFADRRPRFPTLPLGCVLQAAACGVLAVAQGTQLLVLGTALLGLGPLGVALSVPEIVARESEPEQHDRLFGLLTAAVSLGQLIGPLVAGFLVVASDLQGSTTRAMLAAAALSALATGLALASHLHRTARLPEPGLERQRLGSILKTRGVPAGIFASTVVLSAADVFTAYMPVLGEESGIAPGMVGVLLALRAGASIASRVGIGPIVERLGRVSVLWGSAAVAAAAFGAMTLTRELVALAALSLVAGFALGFGQPLSMTIMVQLVPERARATALGVRLMGNRAGQVAAPAVAGLVSGTAGASAVFWFVSGLLVFSAAALRRVADAFAAPAGGTAGRDAAP